MGYGKRSKSTLIGRSAVYDDLDLYGSRADDTVAGNINTKYLEDRLGDVETVSEQKRR
jgi:hypothetical protein